jgi:hypothetical protein
MPKQKKKRLQMQRRHRSRFIADNQWLLHKRQQEVADKYRSGTPKQAYIDPSGTEEQWEARMFHAWLNGRNIPIVDLCILFNRDEATIRRWLKMAG